SCTQNQLRSLDVSGCTALTELYCEDNQLSSLDVSNNTALEHLSCVVNQLSSLDVSINSSLEFLDCSMNQLTELNVSNNTEIKRLNLVEMRFLNEVCVWTWPFPTDSVIVSTSGSPNVYFTTDCGM
ncbi:hypothetical protein ACFLTU_09190, partial [Bacteroidota bacterium]